MSTWSYLAEGPTVTDGTEQDLAATTTKGHYGLYLDLAWMIANDTVIVRIYEEVNSNAGAVQHVIEQQTFVGVQNTLNHAWPIAQLGENAKWTIEHSAGTTGESIEWSVRLS